MPSKHGGIGGEGLEQGGPSLGNDYARPDMSVGNAGDALSTPNTIGLKGNEKDLAIDGEGSRNLSPDADDTESSEDELIEDDFADEEDDEDFDELDEGDENGEDNALERGI